MCNESHTGSYSQTAVAGPRRSRSQCWCSCHSPLPFASKTQKEQAGLQGTMCSPGQEGWTQPATATDAHPGARQAMTFESFRIAQIQKRECMLLHNPCTIYHRCVSVWKLKANHLWQKAAIKFKKTSLFCCILLLCNATTMCANKAVKIIY